MADGGSAASEVISFAEQPRSELRFFLAPGGAFLRFMGYINFALQIPHFCGERSKIVFGIRLSHLRLK